MEETRMIDFIVRQQEKDRGPGLKTIEAVCKELKEKGVEAEPCNDIYWGIKLRIGDRVIKLDMLEYQDKVADTKASNRKPDNDVILFKIPMKTIQLLLYLHLGQKALKGAALRIVLNSIGDQLLSQYETWKKEKRTS